MKISEWPTGLDAFADHCRPSPESLVVHVIFNSAVTSMLPEMLRYTGHEL